ncbi:MULTISPECIES: hypothetical protein [Haloarcula]|uniref:Uncharacterized protein n=2 Tax=Haloarcula TaxID=2237 RepID=A0ACC6VRR1_9EURY|nr:MULTISPECIES: hypothetical protein [Haloarcula]EMA31463.1 hypothetical protein C444_08165 [Haloarcula japonica DSM 6131]
MTEPTVVVLDEGDNLPETDILDVLQRISDILSIAICHEISLGVSRRRKYPPRTERL